jgi:antitoxin MazE
MKIDIIPIGNSRGIRIPKSLLEQCGFGTTATLEIQDNHLLISPVAKPREGWEEAFKAMAAAKDDQLLETPSTSFDENEWQW